MPSSRVDERDEDDEGDEEDAVESGGGGEQDRFHALPSSLLSLCLSCSPNDFGPAMICQ